MKNKWRFWGKIGDETLDLGFTTPKGTSLRGIAQFDVFCVKIVARVSAVAFLNHPTIPISLFTIQLLLGYDDD